MTHIPDSLRALIEAGTLRIRPVEATLLRDFMEFEPKPASSAPEAKQPKRPFSEFVREYLAHSQTMQPMGVYALLPPGNIPGSWPSTVRYTATADPVTGDIVITSDDGEVVRIIR